MPQLYTVKRFYSDGRRARVQRRNFTLEQARQWCSHRDSSSRTHPQGRNGVTCDWFDGFTAQ